MPDPELTIAGHTAEFDSSGRLKPWTSWRIALDREMQFYQRCPVDHGYPRFVHATFLDADWNASDHRTDSIPATQNGMGILSYLKYQAFRGGDPRYLATARLMGDYLITESLTPPVGKYPAFTRSTGFRDRFPLAEDSGSQGDRPYEIQPDKGGIAGYALWLLYQATGELKYAVQARHNARVLASNQLDGDGSHSPWPFRVDYRSGQGRGCISGNMTYVLRLYDALLAGGNTDFAGPRQALWGWINRFQIPDALAEGRLFAQFFEDHDTPTNRTAWAPLNLARYLLDERSMLHGGWLEDCRLLIDFVRRNFTHAEYGITVCHEQDEDKEAWGGINSTYGAVLAQFARATEAPALALDARQALDFTLYCIDEQGRPRDIFKNGAPGGWQEDAHTDVIHNYVDAMRAFPEWAEAT